MKAIILAAGRGSRLENLTSDVPKCLIKLNGKSLLNYQLEALKGAGINEIGIVVGYLAHKINHNGLIYFKNERWSQTNMLFSLTCAKKWLESDAFIMSYSDIIYNSSVINSLASSDGDIVVPYNPDWLRLWKARFNDPLSDAETFKTDKNSILKEIGKKTNDLKNIEGQYMGLLKITPSGWSRIENYLNEITKDELDRFDITRTLQGLIETGTRINTIPISEKWFEIDSKRDLELYPSLC